MDALKRIPVKYIGELHDIRLINFSVAIDEVKDKVPYLIKTREIGGRAMFSMVDVKLKRMHPSFVPALFHFDYRHIAFRLLVEDGQYNAGVNKGIFFYRAFTNKPIIVAGGRMLTNYNLELAKISEVGNRVVVEQDKSYVSYAVGTKSILADEKMLHLQKKVGALDRAYSVLGEELRVTQIQREKWPIEPVECTAFENTFFETARFEGAFRVFEVIYYQWLPSKVVL